MGTPLNNARLEKALISLLAQPRTREGLIAMGRAHGMSAHFVYGWLTNSQRIGTVVKHRAGSHVTYSLSTGVVEEGATPSTYPAWLDPRTLPVSRGRTVVVDGVVISSPEIEAKRKTTRKARK